MSSFLRKFILFLVLAIAGLITLDVNKHGSFKASKTGIFLRDSGALEYGELAFTKFRRLSQEVYRWSRNNLPGYMKSVRENVTPFLYTVKEMLVTLAMQFWANIRLVYQYFVDKKPAVVQWINQYAPGLVDSVGRAWALFTEYTSQLYNFLLKYLLLALDWLRENVFVGKLSPENLQRYTMEAFNTTQKLATQTLSWFNSRVVTVTSAP